MAAISTEGYLQHKVDTFVAEQRAFYDALIARRFASETRAGEAFRRIQDMYFPIEAALTEHLSSFSDGHGGIDESRFDAYMETTALYHRISDAFTNGKRAFDTTYPSLAAASVAVAPLADHIPKTVVFYYPGKGDLFIHGEGLAVLDERGMPKALSWEDRHPLRLIADNLWSATVYVPPGKEGAYKVSNSGAWSNGPNLRLAADTTLKLQIPTFEIESPLCLPLKITPDTYRLCLLGEGNVRLASGEVRALRWNGGIEMTPMGSALWRADVRAEGLVKYKICLMSPTGELTWENGENRTLVPGESFSHLPSFTLPEGVRVEELSPERIKREDLIRVKLDERLALEAAHREVIIGGAGRAAAVASTALLFVGKEIIDTHLLVDFALLDGTPINAVDAPPDAVIKAKAKDGNWVLYQQAPTGCTAGASAYLLMDVGVVPDITVLKTRVATHLEFSVKPDLEANGLTPKLTNVREARTLEQLKLLLEANGPAALRIESSPTFAHAIVVDAISADCTRVRLRDPWHGWDITITAEAFLKTWNPITEHALATGFNDYIVQVDRSKLK